MFKGDYSFFDYKYNIEGYHGQDFSFFPQFLYLIISVILLIILLMLLKKASREKVLRIIRMVGVFLIVFYIGKTIWESVHDIKLTGSFNTGLLPFDTCSIIMLACFISGFSKGKIREYGTYWLTTGGIVGGIGAMLFLNAFKYYPFFSFGAFYSMIWHFLMVFIGILLLVTGYVDVKYDMVIKGFAFHFLFSLIIIPIDFICNFDFMMYKDLGGIPIFEDIASYFTSINLQILNPFLMLLLYFSAFNIIYVTSKLVKKISNFIYNIWWKKFLK